jgi:hypothetical protein
MQWGALRTDLPFPFLEMAPFPFSFLLNSLKRLEVS